MTHIEAFKQALSRASYHYADDTAQAWSLGAERVREAASIAVEAGWTDEQVAGEHAKGQYLVYLEDLLRAVQRARAA